MPEKTDKQKPSSKSKSEKVNQRNNDRHRVPTEALPPPINHTDEPIDVRRNSERVDKVPLLIITTIITGVVTIIVALISNIEKFKPPPLPTVVFTSSSMPSLIPSTTFTPTLMITSSPVYTSTLTLMLTATPFPTKTFSPSATPSCGQLRNSDFKITLPIGTHGAETNGNRVPQLKEHAPIAWEPSYCPLTIKVYRGGVPVRTYDSKQSGEISTDFLVTDYPGFTSGDWIEIKVWIPNATTPSDNIHIKLP